VEPSVQCEAEVERWHAEHDARLRSSDGWLALVGLHWLTPGEHEFGQHPSNGIRLSGPGVPPLAHAGQPVHGELEVEDDLG
jgi:uncharacterized protein (DUF1684 family)